MTSRIERHVGATTHGRCLIVPPAAAGPAPALVGFHGYAESADEQLERLLAIPGAERWVLVSIQGLHRFYQRRTNEVVAGWMTRQDRELAIADNIAYVANALQVVAAEQPLTPPMIFAGFSQGVAMAFRAAVSAPRSPVAVIAVGGDVPPELEGGQLRCISAALVCRGARDAWYGEAQLARDITRLQESGVRVCPLAFDGGHDWPGEVSAAAAAFIEESRGSAR
jgi:predicted esterase